MGIRELVGIKIYKRNEDNANFANLSLSYF